VEVKKFINRPADQMEDVLSKTKDFTERSIPWFKTLIPILKQLMEKSIVEKTSSANL
jgi:hypothetical protein